MQSIPQKGRMTPCTQQHTHTLAMIHIPRKTKIDVRLIFFIFR